MPVATAIQNLLQRRIAHVPPDNRHQSILLVAFCRSLGKSLTENHEQQDSLVSVLKNADKVLQSAVDIDTQKMDDMIGNFENTIREYCQIYPHHDYHDFPQNMKKAKDEDRKLAKKILRFKQNHGNRHASGPPCDQVSVDIFLGKKPLTLEEKWIRSKIDSYLSLEAVQWMLEQKENITLSQNPFFYRNLPDSYGSDFCTDPLSFGKELGTVLPADHVLIVLIDRNNDILVKCDDGYRVFGNCWKPNGDLILKDRVAGTLEAAKRVSESMNGSSKIKWSLFGYSKPQDQITDTLEVLLGRAPYIEDRIIIKPIKSASVANIPQNYPSATANVADNPVSNNSQTHSDSVGLTNNYIADSVPVGSAHISVPSSDVSATAAVDGNSVSNGNSSRHNVSSHEPYVNPTVNIFNGGPIDQQDVADSVSGANGLGPVGGPNTSDTRDQGSSDIYDEQGTGRGSNIRKKWWQRLLSTGNKLVEKVFGSSTHRHS